MPAPAVTEPPSPSRRHRAEVKERWRATDAYKASTARSRLYTQADWQRFKTENEAVHKAVAALIDEGAPPTDPRALAATEDARLLIDRWFYSCSRVMHARLGELYLADARFAAMYERIRSGMARFMRDATAAHAARVPGARGSAHAPR